MAATTYSANWQEVFGYTDTILSDVAERIGAERAHVFHFQFDGEDQVRSLHNTAEVTREGAKAFQQELLSLPSASLPAFSAGLAKRQAQLIAARREMLEEMEEERREMEREGIDALALVPGGGAPLLGRADGWLGVDMPRPRDWKSSDMELLSAAADAVFALMQLAQLSTAVPCWQAAALRASGSEESLTSVQQMVPHEALARVLPILVRSSLVVGAAVGAVAAQCAQHLLRSTPMLRPLALLPSTSRTEEGQLAAAREHFARLRYVWLTKQHYAENLPEQQLSDFMELCKQRWHEMVPDVGIYNNVRDVGYARYRYLRREVGTTFAPLKHKPFFQVDPATNVVVGGAARPFSRIPDDVREHPALMAVVRTLLEDVWNGELGNEVQVHVHPVRVRNFQQLADGVRQIHGEKPAPTLEGTHSDSTERVAVMMIERHNVHPSGARTALYPKDTTMGLRRDKPEDEAILAPRRLADVQLMESFDTISFDDTEFKHDASDFEAEDPTKESWRSVMLLMCRRPVLLDSPHFEGVCDGWTPRSPRC